MQYNFRHVLHVPAAAKPYLSRGLVVHEIEVVAAEIDFQFNRVEKTPNQQYVVIDYKTGYQSENKKSIRKNIQINVYSLAVFEKFGVLPVKASLFYLKHGKMVDYAPDAENLEREKLRLSSIIDDVLLERFPKTPADQTCRFCDYVDLCEEKEAQGR